jgi:diguanylate cyclase (GGDEF)-like protein
MSPQGTDSFARSAADEKAAAKTLHAGRRQAMSRLAAKLYLAVVVTLAAGALMMVLPSIRFDRPAHLIALLFFSSVSSVYAINAPPARWGRRWLTAACAVDLSALLIVGPYEAVFVAAAGSWGQHAFRIGKRPPPSTRLHTVAVRVLTMLAAGQAGLMVAPQLEGWPGAAAFVACSLAYFSIHSLLGFLGHAVSVGTPRKGSTMQALVGDGAACLMGATLAAAASFAVVRDARWLIPFAAVVLYLGDRTYRLFLAGLEAQHARMRQASELHWSAIEALATAVDAKDRPSQPHVRREQLYAAELARAVGMTADEIEGVRTAALLHDIGKLAVPDHILSKPGPLTYEEFQKVRIHPQVGADIIGAVPFPYPVAPLILNHHERWDGKGYPSGIQGDRIPLGARILAVVDYFEALTSERPYHRAMNRDAAVNVLSQEAGRALDPLLVARFVELLPSLEAMAEPAARTAAQALAPAGAAVQGPVQARATRTAALEDIALAHREIYALYEIAQAMGSSLGVTDTMTIIASKLRTLVPFSACALFLAGEADDSLRCRFATGVDQELLQQLSVKNGHGLVGWVARNRRALVNARPAADFETAGLTAKTTTLQAAIICPLLYNERLIGVLSLYHVGAGCYGDDHRRLLARVSEQAAAVLFNSIVFEQTQEDSLTDALTGLPNTRFMEMHLRRELARAARLRSDVSLLVIDVDNFKEVNDSFGHHVGDHALREIARILRATIRPYDICVRYAGDEFIVVLSDCGAGEAESRMLELQRVVDSAYFEAKPGRRLQIGISAGAAVFRRDGETYEALLAAADSRMYRDKARRRRQQLQDALPASHLEPSAPTGPLSEIDLQRAAAGIL